MAGPDLVEVIISGHFFLLNRLGGILSIGGSVLQQLWLDLEMFNSPVHAIREEK